MSKPRLPLLALVLALLATGVVGPGSAATVGTGSAGTPTLTLTEPVETTDLPTVTVTATEVVGTETVEQTADTVVETVDDTTDGAPDTVENTTDGTTDTLDDTTNETTDTLNDTVHSTTSMVGDTASGLTGDGSLDSALSVEAVLSADGADGATPRSTTPDATPTTRTERADTMPPGTTDTAVPPPDRNDGLSLDGPASPLAGGAALGGVIALGGLAGRGLLAVNDSPVGTGRTASTAVRRLAAGWGDRLWRLLGLFGYQRFDGSDPLDHAGRERLYERIRAEPGVHLSAVSEAADLPLSTARYHLRVLEHEGLVRAVKLHGKRRFFPPDVEAEALVAALADGPTAAVLCSLVREGPGSVSEVADRLDRDPSTVSHHLDRLAGDGLVERERDGPAVVSSPTPAVEAAVEELDVAESGVVQPRPAATSD